ncbi:hypothetical protein VTG60DRAFT_6260 [Thermothelomyces hinnuleus]
MVEREWNPFGPIPAIGAEARIAAEKLYSNLKETFPGLVDDFERKFTAWQGKWFNFEALGLSSALERCELPEYDPLIFLGPKIIPLVVYELTKPGSCIATALYNHLETDRGAKVDPEDVSNYLTLNRHANLIVELNHERAQLTDTRMRAWKERCAAASTSPYSNGPDADIACEEYDALVQMGSSIIAHVMLEFSKDQSGPWYKLMYQLVREKPMTSAAREDRWAEANSYSLWRDWFEHREHHEACEHGFTPSYLTNVVQLR